MNSVLSALLGIADDIRRSPRKLRDDHLYRTETHLAANRVHRSVSAGILLKVIGELYLLARKPVAFAGRLACVRAGRTLDQLGGRLTR
jgi:hypothetical protein